MDNDKLIFRRIADIYRLCDKYQTPRFSDFLDETEKAKIQLAHADSNGRWFGGYDGSARQMLGFFPDWYEKEDSEFPIACVKITNKGNKKLSHREYLGTIMSLGLKRQKIGDITVGEDFAYVFVTEDAKDTVATIEKISSCGVKSEILPLAECEIPKAEFELVDTVVASLRLDAVVGAVCKFSRKNATDFIMQGRCEVNHIERLRTDYPVKVGDLLSMRGFGRAEIMEVNGETRSGRLHVTIKKYI